MRRRLTCKWFHAFAREFHASGLSDVCVFDLLAQGVVAMQALGEKFSETSHLPSKEQASTLKDFCLTAEFVEIAENPITLLECLTELKSQVLERSPDFWEEWSSTLENVLLL